MNQMRVYCVYCLFTDNSHMCVSWFVGFSCFFRVVHDWFNYMLEKFFSCKRTDSDRFVHWVYSMFIFTLWLSLVIILCALRLLEPIWINEREKTAHWSCWIVFKLIVFAVCFLAKFFIQIAWICLHVFHFLIHFLFDFSECVCCFCYHST